MKKIGVYSIIGLAIAATNCGSGQMAIRQQLEKKGSIGVSFKNRDGSHTGPATEKYRFLQQIVVKNLANGFPGQKVQAIDEKDAAVHETHVQVIIWLEPGKDHLDATKEIGRVRVGMLILDKTKKNLSGIGGESLTFVETDKNMLSDESVNKVKTATEKGIQRWIEKVKAAKE